MSLTTSTPGSVRAIEQHSVSDQVTAELRRSIVSGDLAPEQSLSLRKLAEQRGSASFPSETHCGFSKPKDWSSTLPDAAPPSHPLTLTSCTPSTAAVACSNPTSPVAR